MIQAFFNGLSGLFSFSHGLKNVSSNVSNMNTPGYRGTDSFFRNVGGQDGEGLGVVLTGTALRTTQGELRQSGNATDLAINGRGFFILESESGDRYYTRAGQFRLDSNYRLVDTVSGHRVMALGSGNTVSPMDLSSRRLLPPVATTTIDFRGNLITSSTGGGANTHTISNVQVFDAAGTAIPLTVTFTQDAAQTRRWNVSVTSTTLGNVGSGTVEFGLDGTPAAGQNSVTVTLTSNGNAQTLTLSFGAPGSLSGLTSYSGASSDASATARDGSAMSGLSTLTADEKGVFTLTYANGKKETGPQVALAFFPDESQLTQDSRALFTAGTLTPQVGAATTSAFGKVQGGYLELSNVDLAQEFGDLIIIQRGYQASSRVMTVASEMIEQLYNNGRGN